MEVFDFDSSIEVAFLGLVTLLMVALIQVSLKQSFTPGEVIKPTDSNLCDIISFFYILLSVNGSLIAFIVF